MQLKFLKFLILFITVISLFFGLIAFSYPTFHHVSDFQIQKLNNDGSFSAKSTVVLENYSWFSYSGQNIDLKLFYNDSLLSKGTVEKKIDFVRKESVKISVQSELFPMTLGDSLEKILLKDSLEFIAEIQGDFTFLNLHARKEMKIKLPVSEFISSIVASSLSEQSLRLDSMRFESVSVGESSISGKMNFINTLNIEYEIKDVDFNIFSTDKNTVKIASGGFQVNQVVKPLDTAIASLNFNINHLTAIGSVLGKMKKREFSYSINGIAHVILNGSKVQVPIRKTFLINPLKRTIKVE